MARRVDIFYDLDGSVRSRLVESDGCLHKKCRDRDIFAIGNHH